MGRRIGLIKNTEPKKEILEEKKEQVIEEKEDKKETKKVK